MATADKSELEELKENCTWQWTTQNGIKGYKVTSKKNGNSIFLPAAGYYRGSSHNRAGEYGAYWRSTPSDPNSSNYLYFDSGNHSVYRGDRYCGVSVRPISE